MLERVEENRIDGDSVLFSQILHDASRRSIELAGDNDKTVGFIQVFRQTQSEAVPKSSFERLPQFRLSYLVHFSRRAFRNPTTIVKNLCNDVAGCSITLAFNNDERAVALKAKNVDPSA